MKIYAVIPQALAKTSSPIFGGLTITGCAVLGLNSAVLKPTTDSTTFFQVNDKDGNVILNGDTVNNRVGIGTASSDNAKLHVAGGYLNLDDTYAIVWGGGTGRPGVIGSKSAQTIRLSATNGVGININPTYDLHIGGSTPRFAIVHSGSGNGMRFGVGSGGPALTFVDTGFFSFEARPTLDSGDPTGKGFTILGSNGNIGISETVPETLLELTHATPYATLHNSTHEDSDGGRESRIQFFGEQSGGEETTLVLQEAGHDGVADDQKGYWDLYTNDGSDGDSPTKQIRIQSTGDWVINKTSGVGIKVDLSTPTFGFADLLGDQFSRNTGGTKPTLTAYNDTVDAWQFSDGDEAYLSYHIPHDYVPSTDIYLHVHWSQNNAGATGGTIDFKYFALYAKGHNQVSGSTFTGFEGNPITATFPSININDAGSGLLQYQQHLTEVIISGAAATTALFDRDDFEPDGVIELTLEMDANNLTGTPSDPFIHYVDIHYQTTGLIGTKGKAPDFYT